jgi:DNA-binding MarR family transcriptional regulator
MAPVADEIKQKRPFPTKGEEAAVALMRTSDLVRRVIADVVQPHGITPQQYNVLRILRGAGDCGLPTLEIAERMVEQTPGITRLIDRLEARKLAVRERCATDRRQVFCKITPAGLALLKQLDKPVAEAGRVFDAFSPRDLQQLVKLLDRTRDAILNKGDAA